MSIADGVELALAMGREAAAELMTSSCTIVRKGTPVTDGDGDVTTPETLVYGTVAKPGRCKVQTYEAQESTPEAGGATVTVQRYRLDIPVGSYAPRIGDVATIRAETRDPQLVGRKFRIAALLHKSQATAYRLGVKEVL